AAAKQKEPITKFDLMEYYDSIARYILPHLRDRPLSLRRFPDGIYGKSFFHKNWTQNAPEYVKRVKIFSESAERVINYIVCNNSETLTWLVSLGCIEIHPWYSRVRNYAACSEEASARHSPDGAACGLAAPDYIVFDLDPYLYSGKEREGEEPEYHRAGFAACV